MHHLGLLQLQVLYHTLLGFTSAHLLRREEVLLDLTLPCYRLSPPELLDQCNLLRIPITS